LATRLPVTFSLPRLMQEKVTPKAKPTVVEHCSELQEQTLPQ
jgi:hypothetical protein